MARISPEEPGVGLSSQYILNVAAGIRGNGGLYGRGARALKLMHEAVAQMGQVEAIYSAKREEAWAALAHKQALQGMLGS